MESLSVEEDNYVRMSLLLTQISPRAVRTFFDSEFAPACLYATLKKEYNTLLDLKKNNRINQSQWNLLFPRYPDVPDSKTFDVTLMTTLLRNLTPLNPPLGGFDRLPSVMETSPASDLARIKYYRSFQVHLDDGKLDTTYMTTAWTNMTGAIYRLGGTQMKLECDHLKTKPLDQTNQEVMTDIKPSNDEIRVLKESHQLLREDHRKVTKEMEILESTLSAEEENYVRMSLLLTGISSHAVRTFFDSEFAPACLEATIKKEYNKLFELKKKHKINQSQWNLLFPRLPDVPDSKTFDVTLMILLLRFLTPLTPPLYGFDRLPSDMEITPAADLARIKHYRNYLAHLDEGKLDIGSFNTAWNVITCAIDRLGGQQIKQECDLLKTRTLDQTHQEIMTDIKHSNDGISKLKESLRSLTRSHSDMFKSHELLQGYHRGVKKSHELLQEEHAKMTKEMKIMKISQEDTVPWNIRGTINDTLKYWKDNDDRMFISTRAAQYVLKCIQENSCVTITASSGVGKTATLRHVALQMKEEGYDILIVTDPEDIVKFYNPNKKTLFVVDDLCGNFSLDQSDFKIWEPIMENINNILDKKETKILAACRLQVYQDEKFDALSVFKSCVCNMLSENMCLSKKEKKSIAELYLNAKVSEISDLYDIYDCFPLLCKLYHDNPELVITDFFQNPFSIYEAEIDKFQKKGHHAKYCALALCVMFNNHLKEEMFTEEVNEEARAIIENTCEACRLDRGTSRLVLQDELESLIHTFMKKEKNMYKISHDKIFDFLVKIYGQRIIYCLIRNANSGLIKERFTLEKNDDMDQFIIIVPTQYHQMYIQRMIDDWSNGKLQDVFSNINMKIPLFRKKFLYHLKTLDMSYQRQLANICEPNEDNNDLNYVHYNTAILHKCTYYGESPIIIACKHGHTEIVKFLLDIGADYSKCDKNGQSPLMKACENGYTEIVRMLLDIGADYNKCDVNGQSPLMKVCKHGHPEIVRMLLDIGADYNKCNNDGQSPLMKACKHGHPEIVRMLLDIGADYNKCDVYGQSPLMKVCEHGHTEIVRMLLDIGADYNKCNKDGQSPLMKACKHGHPEIVRMLLDIGADYNKCDVYGQSLLMKVCEHGHTEIVRMLLDIGADYNKCNKDGQSPLMKACKHGHPEIVRMLLDIGADYNKCEKDGQSPLIKVCEQGYTKIVRMLLDIGADYNKCNKDDQSPLMKACEHGHIEIVRMLLDKGADYNRCGVYGQSPFMKACKHGHPAVVRMLLNIGADYNKCNKYGQSPLMKACEHGYTDIVRMLLDIGADYNKCNEDGQSPLIKVCKHGYAEIVRMLLDIGADYNKCNKDGQSPLMKACKHGHIEIVGMLLDIGADYNRCDVYGQSPLMKACEHGHIEIVKMLLDIGADYNRCDVYGQSPFMKACKHGHPAIVRMLLDIGADYNKCDVYGQSPLMKVCEHGHTEIVRMLLDIGADYNKCNEDGQSPLMKACKHGYSDIVRMLYDRGVDYNKRDSDGQLPVRIARKHGHAKIVKLLLDKGADYENYDNEGPSPVEMARKHGPAEIFKMIVDREADLSPCDKWSQSPAMMAGEKDYTEKDAGSSAPIDVLCDGIHIVCFTDTKLAMKCIYYANSFMKEKTVSHGQESSLLKCDGHLIHCIQDERLSRTFKSINDKALESIVYEDPTIPDFVKLTYIYGLIKRKEFSRESWEDMLKFTIVNKKPVFCYFLLANAETIMTTDQPKFHDILQQALCNAMTNQDKETARGISWFIVRNFYRSLSSSLKETIIDTWPSFECKCDDRNMRKTVPNFCSSSMIIIIETEKAGNDFPKTFWKVNVKYIVNDKIDKNECKEIHKKLQTSLSEVHFLNKVVISGVDAKPVFTEHSNLTLICKSAFKSKGFLKNEHDFVDIPCVQLYCKSKGVIPVGESHFPKTICGLQTDILEGSPSYLAGIRVGDEIGTDEFKRGTLGGFLLVRGVKTFLTCLHVFLNVDELSADNVSLNDENLSMVKLYPRSSAVQNSHECGYIREIAFQVDNEKETSIDAALIEFTAGTSIDSKDYMVLEYGKKSHDGVGMNSDYLNNSCVDYRPLCFSTPRPILQTVSVGAVSGYSDCSTSEVFENTEKSVDLEAIVNVYDKSILDGVKEIAKQIISYFRSISMVGIPDSKTIEQYIEQTCDPDISADAQIKAILCNIVTQVCLKLQSNTNESVENIIQEVALHQPHSSFSAIIGNVHMQKKIITKTRDNMATKRIIRRVYNQLHISNIPFKPGDSGTCIYVLSPVRGCIGMAIANHPLGGCIATPIMEILKHFKIGIK